ncbi:unnamed protein product [Bursaphelenchus xylophilus]|uniref:(pine wood nematode) hypothetical protein n=1 Tax=Bursaphelenchus xylophilus TaxID=6326 RepID=A0A1I7S7T9_BURXY|nr:unnamed protein product [Bursaphelenchus xylophilus]CAG9087011.1 unnamed protein product [Bursaphelenchus xylophilus]
MKVFEKPTVSYLPPQGHLIASLNNQHNEPFEDDEKAVSNEATELLWLPSKPRSSSCVFMILSLASSLHWRELGGKKCKV